MESGAVMRYVFTLRKAVRFSSPTLPGEDPLFLEAWEVACKGTAVVAKKPDEMKWGPGWVSFCYSYPPEAEERLLANLASNLASGFFKEYFIRTENDPARRQVLFHERVMVDLKRGEEC